MAEGEINSKDFSEMPDTRGYLHINRISRSRCDESFDIVRMKTERDNFQSYVNCFRSETN